VRKLLFGGMVVVGFLVILGIAAGQEAAKSKLLNGFENDADLAGMEFTDCDHELVKDKAVVTQGESALKLKIKKTDGASGVEFLPENKMLRGWEAYDLLQIDVNNKSDKDVEMSFRFDDKASTNYQTRANIVKTLRPGANTVKFMVKELTRENGEKMNIADLNRVLFFVWQPTSEFEVIFDNVRLEKE